MRGVILAGGLGTRLYPVTLETPKPLLTVKRKPILSHLVGFFEKYGVSEPIVLVSKKHLEDYQWWKKRHQKDLPQKIKIRVEPEPLGTFGGLKFLEKDLPTTFVMSNGDELKDFNLNELIEAHKNNKNRPAATIALTSVSNPSEYGVAVMKGNRIEKFLEKPKNPPSNYISSGLYILEPEVFKYADWSKGFLMIERDIFPKLAAAGKLAGHKIKNGRWYDCGTFERWEKAIKEW